MTLFAPEGRILVKEIVKEKKTSGGIVLPNSLSDPDNTCRIGEIVSNSIKSENTNHLDISYSVGNMVYFGKHSGALVVFDDERYISLTKIEIAAISDSQ